MDKMRRWVRNQRGSILLFTTILALPLMIIIGGLAMDLAYYGTVDDELQRSMDAAALAGAGKLGFNDTFFPAARQWAHDYAQKNAYRDGSTLANINLDLNEANDPSGPIVLGIWDGAAFAPSLDGTRVNAVQCRFTTTAATSFLRLIGVNSLNAGAMAIAWAAQPITTPQSACVFPVAVSDCFFKPSSDPTSLGCGATATFISSASPPGSPTVGINTAAWASVIPGQDPNNGNILAQVQAAAGGTCGGTPLNTNDGIPVNNGQLNDIMNWLRSDDPNAFPAKYTNSLELVVFKQDGVTEAYRGKGWEVFVPVIDTGAGCPPTGPINGTKTITGWTRFVITQVQGKNGQCAVNNPWQRGGAGNPWDSHCFNDKNGTSPHGPTGTVVSGETGIYGYYDCQYTPVAPAPNPGPITATAKLKLVK
jgi:Flp pilus assembly protein TadG